MQSTLRSLRTFCLIRRAGKPHRSVRSGVLLTRSPPGQDCVIKSLRETSLVVSPAGMSTSSLHENRRAVSKGTAGTGETWRDANSRRLPSFRASSLLIENLLSNQNRPLSDVDVSSPIWKSNDLLHTTNVDGTISPLSCYRRIRLYRPGCGGMESIWRARAKRSLAPALIWTSLQQSTCTFHHSRTYVFSPNFNSCLHSVPFSHDVGREISAPVSTVKGLPQLILSAGLPHLLQWARPRCLFLMDLIPTSLHLV